MNNSTVRQRAAQTFSKAAEYIYKYGWQIEGMSFDGQPRCSMGALASAYPKRNWEADIATLMYESLMQQLAGLSLTEFNHRVKDGAEVAKLFERTARAISI